MSSGRGVVEASLAVQPVEGGPLTVAAQDPLEALDLREGGRGEPPGLGRIRVVDGDGHLGAHPAPDGAEAVEAR